MTLVELLVVVAILAVLGVSTSVLAFRGAGASGSDADLHQFRRAYAHAQLLAIQGRSPRGLNVTSDGLQRLHHDAEGWQGTGTLRRWQGRVTLALSGRPLRQAHQAPDIVLLSNGQSTAFSITFTGMGTGHAPRRCESDGWAELSCTGS